MAIEGLTKEEAQKKLEENKAVSAQIKNQLNSSKEVILRMAINNGASDSELLNLKFDQNTIYEFREKIKRENLHEELKKTIAEQAEETKKINEEQVEDIKFEIKWQLEQKEKEEEAKNAGTVIGRKLRATGLREKDFESIPEWANLTEPQKMLVLEQISQNVLSNVKKIGEKRFNEKNRISFKAKDFNPLRFAKKIGNNLIKSVWISKEEKQAVQDFKNGKLKPDQDVLQSLTERMADLNLKVIENGGKPSIEFIEVGTGAPKEVEEAIKNYNEIANEFSQIPDAWKNERAAKGLGGKKNYEKYIEIEHAYKEAKKIVIDQQAKYYTSLGSDPKLADQKAKLEMKDTDFKVAMMQFTNTNPDATAELKKIENEASIKRLFNNENAWRSLYIGSGYLGRKGLGLLSSFAAPITAATIGWFRSKRKAEQKINTAFSEGREGKTFQEMTAEERLAKRNAGKSLFEDKNANKSALTKVLSGKDVNAREVAGFIDADSQIQRLENTLDKLKNSTSPGEKARLVSELERRLDYVQNKLDEGLINYGTSNPIGNNYELLRLLSQGAVEKQANIPDFTAIPDQLIDIKVMSVDGSSRIEKKQLRDLIQEDNRDAAIVLERLRQHNETRFDDKQAKFKTQEMRRGALVAAGFSTLGWLIRHIQESGHHAGEIVSGGTTTTTSSGLENHNMPAQNVADTVTTKSELSTDTIPSPKINNDSLSIKTSPDVNTDSIPTPPKTAEVTLDDHPKPTDNIENAVKPKIEKIVTAPKPPVIEDNLSKNIKIDNQDVASVPKISTEPIIVDESTIKTEGVDFQEGVNTENAALNTNEVITPINNESIDLSGAHQVTGAPNIVDKMETIPKVPNVDENNIDLSGARKISRPDIVTEKVDEYGLGTVTKTETPILMDDNIRPTQPGGFNNESIGSGKVIKPTGAVGGYNTGEETGNIYPRSGALKGGPNPGIISREVPMTDREAIFTNKGNNVFENGVDNNVNENLPIESDPRHFETAREIRQTFGRQTVLIDKAEYPTIDDTEDGLKYDDWNTANDQLFERHKLEFDSYEDFNKERELQQLFGTNTRVENVPKVVYDPVLGRNVPGPDVRVIQQYFRPTDEWKIVEKIPAKYFMQEDFLNGNNLPKADLDKLVSKGIITQNPLTGTYSFSQRNEVERLSLFYKKLVGSKDYEKFIDKVEHTLGNDRPIGNENMETYIKRITEKVYKADDNTLFGFKRPVDWNDRDSWSRDYDGEGPSKDRMMRPIYPRMPGGYQR